MKYSAAVALFDLSHFLGIEFYLNFNLSPAVSWLSVSKLTDICSAWKSTPPQVLAAAIELNGSHCLRFTSVPDTAADEGLAEGGIPPLGGVLDGANFPAVGFFTWNSR